MKSNRTRRPQEPVAVTRVARLPKRSADHDTQRLVLIALFAALVLIGLSRQASAEDAVVMPVEEVKDAITDALGEADPAEAPQVGWIELSETLRESPSPFAWVPEAEAGPSLRGVLDALATIRDEPRYKGVVLFLDQPVLSMTQCTAIADAMLGVRAAGKTVLVFAEVYDLHGYMIASAADSILLQHKGSVELSGIAVEEMYLAGMLEKIGVKPDLMQIGQYKGADETMMRTGPSKAWDENFDRLLDSLYEQTLQRLVDNRGMTKAEVEALMADSWTLTDEELLGRRAVDQLVDRNLLDVTESFFGEDFEWRTEFAEPTTAVDAGNPFAMFSVLFQEPQMRTSRPTLAVLHAEGPIYSGDSGTGGGFMGEMSIGSRTLVAALEDALLDDHIKGVVVRLDSPGGSALASEVIWQAVREFGKEKPIYSVVTNMAASGGYYIVSATDEVYVQPHSILGSIGVVGGKIALGGVYDWAGVHIVRRTRGPGADLFNSVEPFTPAQREKVKRALSNVYDQFLDRVAIGRGDRLPDVNAVAEGRLFTGAVALANGMADKAGGVGDALADLAAECELEAGDYDVVHLPEPVSLSAYLEGIFGVRAPATAQAPASLAARAIPEIAAVRTLLGPRAWSQVSASLRGLMMLRTEPVLTLLPNPVVFGR